MLIIAYLVGCGVVLVVILHEVFREED